MSNLSGREIGCERLPCRIDENDGNAQRRGEGARLVDVEAREIMRLRIAQREWRIVAGRPDAQRAACADVVEARGGERGELHREAEEGGNEERKAFRSHGPRV